MHDLGLTMWLLHLPYLPSASALIWLLIVAFTTRCLCCLLFCIPYCFAPFYFFPWMMPIVLNPRHALHLPNSSLSGYNWQSTQLGINVFIIRFPQLTFQGNVEHSVNQLRAHTHYQCERQYQKKKALFVGLSVLKKLLWAMSVFLFEIWWPTCPIISTIVT